jgi:hypothetical protein
MFPAQGIAGLLATASDKFKITATKLFDTEGAEIDDVDLIEKNETVIASAGEEFQRDDQKTGICALALALAFAFAFA